jgi:malate dehydrogenase (oxaloacetate-decarboxylating)(NADP+)
LNGLKVVGKDLKTIKLVTSGAGAAALACLDLLVALGLPLANILVTDIKGVVYAGRTEEMDPIKARYAKETKARTLAEAIPGADVFLGLSAGGVLKPEMVKTMAKTPLIFALANPEPEIRPDVAKAARPDAILATGRSDYPNQVNNVLCFPFIFRGALDVGATQVNEAMKVAAVHAIANLAQAEQSDIVASAYGGDENMRFGPDYLIPRPFDPRLITEIAPAVAKAAMESGVAARPIADLDAYRARLQQFVYHSGIVMKPVFAAAKKAPKRIIYAEGEEERVLRAVQIVTDEGLARPILVGRPDVVRSRIDRLGLRIRPGADFELIDPNNDPRYREVWSEYHRIMERKGVRRDDAKAAILRSSTLIACMILRRGEADGMLCGSVGRYQAHLVHVENAIGRRRGVAGFAAMNLLLLPKRTVFICDTYVNPDPTPEQIAEMAVLAAEEVRRFGFVPRVALLSHSNFGSADSASARKMRQALARVEARAAELDFPLEVEGEMHGDAALSLDMLHQVMPHARLTGEANLLIMPNLDAANIAFNLLKVTTGQGITVGPILLGAAKPAHILTPTSTVRRIVNMTALAVVDAGAGR